MSVYFEIGLTSGMSKHAFDFQSAIRKAIDESPAALKAIESISMATRKNSGLSGGASALAAGALGGGAVGAYSSEDKIKGALQGALAGGITSGAIMGIVAASKKPGMIDLGSVAINRSNEALNAMPEKEMMEVANSALDMLLKKQKVPKTSVSFDPWAAVAGLGVGGIYGGRVVPAVTGNMEKRKA